VCYHRLLHLPDEAAYRRAYEERYCARGPLLTHDRMSVFFYPDAFDHAFFQDTDRRGAKITPVFIFPRAKRLLWIEACLEDVSLPSYSRIMPWEEERRLILVPTEPYLVVIRDVRREAGGTSGKFLTAYPVTSRLALSKMRGNPVWRP